MRWADLDLAEGTWSKLPSSTKQKEHHQVPLSAPVRQLLSEIWNEQVRNRSRGEFVFPGSGDTGHRVELKKNWAELCAAAEITGLRLHDLRHSFASHLASGGASLPLIGALLGHANPMTTARYSHLFQDPQRAAVRKSARSFPAGRPSSRCRCRHRGGGADMTDEQGVVRIWDELGKSDLTWINAINKPPDAKRLVELLRSGAPMSLGIRDLLAELLDPGEPDIMGGKLVYQKTSNIFEKIVGRTVQNKKTGEITVKYSKLQVIAD